MVALTLMSATGRAGGGLRAGEWEPLSRTPAITPATTTTETPARTAGMRGRRQAAAARGGTGPPSPGPGPPAPTVARSCRLPSSVSAGPPVARSASWVGGRPGGAGMSRGPDTYGVSRSAVRTASANSLQLAYRSAGALAIALASTGSSAAGRSGRRSGQRGRRLGQMRVHDRQGSRGERRLPASSSNAAQAREYWSARPSTACPRSARGRCSPRCPELAGWRSGRRRQRALAQPEVRQVHVVGPARARRPAACSPA